LRIKRNIRNLKVAILTGSVPRGLKMDRNIKGFRIVILRGWSRWRGGRSHVSRNLMVVMLTGYSLITRLFLFLVNFGCAGLRLFCFGPKCSKSVGLRFSGLRLTSIGL
jgi:hypothetical protein